MRKWWQNLKIWGMFIPFEVCVLIFPSSRTVSWKMSDRGLLSPENYFKHEYFWYLWFFFLDVVPLLICLMLHVLVCGEPSWMWIISNTSISYQTYATLIFIFSCQLSLENFCLWFWCFFPLLAHHTGWCATLFSFQPLRSVTTSLSLPVSQSLSRLSCLSASLCLHTHALFLSLSVFVPISKPPGQHSLRGSLKPA